MTLSATYHGSLTRNLGILPTWTSAMPPVVKAPLSDETMKRVELSAMQPEPTFQEFVTWYADVVSW